MCDSFSGEITMEKSTQERILIIEDDETFQNMLTLSLELNGYKVITAQDGLEGLRIARKENPDLIILDLMLPEITDSDGAQLIQFDRNMGHKVCRMIKFDRRLAHIPVLILTGSDSYEDIELAKKFGADVYVVKTTEHEILLDAIKKLLEKKQ